MSHILRTALVNYSSQQMFALVNDIEAYPHYMAGCVGAEVLQRGDDWLEARLDLNQSGMAQSFVTRNQLCEPEFMKMSLVEGPFERLEGCWSFTPLTDEACKVSFELEYEFANKVLAAAAGKWFENVANRQVDALCGRAKVIYA